MNGKIFNIQKFSIHDGPGIRTTVFMKGCNLRCKWCHNPESQEFDAQMLFHSSKCVGCGRCSAVCSHPFETEKCISCMKCVEVCYHDAREICGREISAEELICEILKDKEFYDASGGGVTFSGGEPLIQAEFLNEILVKCKENKIHTAVETAANVPWDTFSLLIPYLDLIICDIKAFDSALHKKGTGVGNERILENAAKLRDLKEKDVLFRTPYIPGYNTEDIEAISSFAGERKLELMPYHSLCSSKYDSLGRVFETKDVPEPTLIELKTVSSKYENVFFVENGLSK